MYENSLFYRVRAITDDFTVLLVFFWIDAHLDTIGVDHYNDVVVALNVDYNVMDPLCQGLYWSGFFLVNDLNPLPIFFNW